jgi:putative hydrolase of the HAD superfamily
VDRPEPQHLFVDADDTLWENNIYFERVIASVQQQLEPFGVHPDAFREHLNETEREHIRTDGYGTVNFARSLVAAFESFVPPDRAPALSGAVRTLALAIIQHPIELLPGVHETLAYLGSRHSLFLVTKGKPEEQLGKLQSSGLQHFFAHVEVLHEKNPESYRALVETHGLAPERTWMIGNSCRSDINPALVAGLNAVYIPHPNTWVLEREDPLTHPRMLELERFSDLKQHF